MLIHSTFVFFIFIFIFFRECIHRVNIKLSSNLWVVSKVQDTHNHDPVFAEVAGRKSLYVFNERKEKVKASDPNARLGDVRQTLNSKSTPASFKLTDTQLRSIAQV